MKIYMIIFVVGSNDITMEKSFSKVLAYCAAFLVLSACSPKGSASGTYESYTDVAEVNGVSLFYAAEGAGKPVILLHGNGGSHNDLETTHRALAQAGYMVYALDSRGQGANGRLDEYHYKDMAADVYEFIRLKGLEKPAVFGFSDGGIIALQLEVMYPGTLGAIITGGANIFVEGALIPEFAESFLAQPSTEPLVIMLQTEPNMTVEDMKTIKTPSLIMSGEHDLIKADHTRLIGENIQDACVKIIPGEDHGSYICNSPKLAPLILDFFNEIGY
jgi:pimeloyl-ACP methyl ester carboxylesterase